MKLRLMTPRLFIAVLALFACGSFVGSGVDARALRKPLVNWFGPVAISPVDTIRFNYTNLGIDQVMVEWAFTNAVTGEMVCGNFGTPTAVEPGKGVIWDYSQPIIDGQEAPKCDAGRLGTHIEPGESYFDATNRHGLVAWIFIRHQSARGDRQAVDLPTVELFNSMIMPDGSRSAAFGRVLQVVHANPTAPNDLGAFLVPAVLR